MIDLPIRPDFLDQLKLECLQHNIDLSRLKWTTAKDGQFAVVHDRPLIDIDRFLPDGLDQRSLGVTGSRLRVEVGGHYIALAVQRAERKAIRLGHVHGWSMHQIIVQPIDERELSAFREAQRSRKRIEDLQKQLVAAKAAKAAKIRQREDLAEMKAKYGAAPEKVAEATAPEPTRAGAAGVPRAPGRKPTKQSTLFSLEGHDHVSQ